MAVLTRPSLRGVLTASLALAIDRPRAWQALLDDGGDAGRRARLSFLAFACALPLIALSAWIDDRSWASIGHVLLADLVAWLAFAAFSEVVLRRAGRGGAWVRVIAVWNWCNLAQMLLVMPALLLSLVTGCPGWLRLWAGLVVWGWAMWLDWRAIRLGLGDGPAMTWPALWLTLADLGIGVVCQATAEALPGWG